MSFPTVLSFSLKQAQELRGAVPHDAGIIVGVEEFEETAKRARTMYKFNPEKYLDVAGPPLTFLGLMCNTYAVVHRREGAEEARDVLVNSWAAVKMALFAIEQPNKVKENMESLKVVIEGFDHLEKERGSQSNGEAADLAHHRLAYPPAMSPWPGCDKHRAGVARARRAQ